jgi:hypothetical protein
MASDAPRPTRPPGLLNTLRLGRRLVAEVPAEPGRRAFVDITPERDDLDAQAASEGWQRPDHDRAFRVEHWDYDEQQIDGWDYDIGARQVRAARPARWRCSDYSPNGDFNRPTSPTHGRPMIPGRLRLRVEHRRHPRHDAFRSAYRRR